MKRLAVILLLLSVGLNIGLAVKLTRAPEAPPRGAWRERTSVRPAFGDSAAWKDVFHRRLSRMERALELRPDQVEAFRSAQARSGSVLHEHRQRVDAARRSLYDLAADGELTPEQLRPMLQELWASKSRMDSLAAEFVLREMEILDPEQRRTYLELLPLDRGPGHSREGRPERGGRGGRRGR